MILIPIAIAAVLLFCSRNTTVVNLAEPMPGSTKEDVTEVDADLPVSLFAILLSRIQLLSRLLGHIQALML